MRSEKGKAVARIDIEPLASALVSCLDSRFGDLFAHQIKRTDHALRTAPHGSEGLTIIEDPVFVKPGYGIQILLFSGCSYSKFSSPEQAMGVELASQPLTNFAVHSATGSGKSLIWMFPSSLSEAHSTTILITRYPALLDLNDKCEKHLLTTQIWSPFMGPIFMYL